jgi:hypothetical protein
MLRIPASIAVAVVAVGCSYHYGRRVPDGDVSRGIGWDSGLAYGSAAEMASARGHYEPPVHASVDCNLLLVKVLLAPAAGYGIFKANASPEATAGLSALAALVLVLAPNCFSALTYAPLPAPVEAPSVTSFDEAVPRRKPARPRPDFPVAPVAPEQTTPPQQAPDPAPTSPP